MDANVALLTNQPSNYSSEYRPSMNHVDYSIPRQSSVQSSTLTPVGVEQVPLPTSLSVPSMLDGQSIGDGSEYALPPRSHSAEPAPMFHCNVTAPTPALRNPALAKPKTGAAQNARVRNASMPCQKKNTEMRKTHGSSADMENFLDAKRTAEDGLWGRDLQEMWDNNRIGQLQQPGMTKEQVEGIRAWGYNDGTLGGGSHNGSRANSEVSYPVGSKANPHALVTSHHPVHFIKDRATGRNDVGLEGYKAWKGTFTNPSVDKPLTTSANDRSMFLTSKKAWKGRLEKDRSHKHAPRDANSASKNGYSGSGGGIVYPYSANDGEHTTYEEFMNTWPRTRSNATNLYDKWKERYRATSAEDAMRHKKNRRMFHNKLHRHANEDIHNELYRDNDFYNKDGSKTKEELDALHEKVRHKRQVEDSVVVNQQHLINRERNYRRMYRPEGMKARAPSDGRPNYPWNMPTGEGLVPQGSKGTTMKDSYVDPSPRGTYKNRLYTTPYDDDPRTTAGQYPQASDNLNINPPRPSLQDGYMTKSAADTEPYSMMDSRSPSPTSARNVLVQRVSTSEELAPPVGAAARKQVERPGTASFGLDSGTVFVESPVIRST